MSSQLILRLAMTILDSFLTTINKNFSGFRSCKIIITIWETNLLTIFGLIHQILYFLSHFSIVTSLKLGLGDKLFINFESQHCS